jgi:hypothetical protein
MIDKAFMSKDISVLKYLTKKTKLTEQYYYNNLWHICTSSNLIYRLEMIIKYNLIPKTELIDNLIIKIMKGLMKPYYFTLNLTTIDLISHNWDISLCVNDLIIRLTNYKYSGKYIRSIYEGIITNSKITNEQKTIIINYIFNFYKDFMKLSCKELMVLPCEIVMLIIKNAIDTM